MGRSIGARPRVRRETQDRPSGTGRVGRNQGHLGGSTPNQRASVAAYWSTDGRRNPAPVRRCRPARRARASETCRKAAPCTAPPRTKWWLPQAWSDPPLPLSGKCGRNPKRERGHLVRHAQLHGRVVERPMPHSADRAGRPGRSADRCVRVEPAEQHEEDLALAPSCRAPRSSSRLSTAGCRARSCGNAVRSGRCVVDRLVEQPLRLDRAVQLSTHACSNRCARAGARISRKATPHWIGGGADS